MCNHDNKFPQLINCNNETCCFHLGFLISKRHKLALCSSCKSIIGVWIKELDFYVWTEKYKIKFKEFEEF